MNRHRSPEQNDLAGARYTSTAETHVGVVFFVGDRAYKLKKPVDLGFLDFRERATRRRILHREYELNYRLAPDVYLGVADIGIEGEEPCDHVLVMRRMPIDRSLSALVEAGEDVDQPVRDVARKLAGFHSCGQRDERIESEGTPQAVRARWDGNLQGLQSFAGDLLDEETLDQIVRRGSDFLSGREALLNRRLTEERVVDGHGDLLAEDIFCLDDGPRILDCLEFDDQLRWLDALDDAACLAMDLEHHGNPGLAQRFLTWYAQFANDTAPASLRHFYTAYRALVRTKVACLKHTPGDDDAATDARCHLQLAMDHIRATTATLIMVGGPPGSGKTTLSEAIADRLGATLCSSDRVRKELAGISPTEHASADYRSGLYAPEHTDRTYAELARMAGELLAHGESVVLDASWSRQEHRDTAVDTAARSHSDVVAFRCTASEEAVSHRLRERTASISDADEAIAETAIDDADPWPQAHAIHTDKAPEDSVRQAFDALGLTPRTVSTT